MSSHDNENHGSVLLRNNGNGTFTAITIGSIVTDRLPAGVTSYAGLWFDYDNNGFLDLFVPNGNDPGTAMVPSFLYHNDTNSNACHGEDYSPSWNGVTPWDHLNNGATSHNSSQGGWIRYNRGNKWPGT